MLELIRNHSKGWLAKIILAVITIPFALFGIDQYLSNAGGNVPVAKVDKDEISLQEYSNTVESVRTRMMAQGEKFDPAVLDSPLFKKSILDGLIMRRLVNAETNRANFTISDAQLNQHILSLPEFQDNGQFSQDIYQSTLEQNGLTANQLESNIRNDLAVVQVRDDLAKLAFAPKSVAENTVKYQYQKRDVTTAELKTSAFLSDVKVTPEQVKDYYELHKDKFKVPEKVKMEFVLLSAANLIGDVKVSDEEVKAFYDQNLDKFQGDEQREASHILIGFGVNASGEDKAKAKEKALEIDAQLKADPKRFEELAVKFSQDPGSATKGGSLGSFGRGAMVKPFEDAVFAMQVGDISDVVESEFGYHIIRLDGVTGNSSSYEDMKPQIKAELIFQKAQVKYAELTEEFSNIVYEQSGSLQPVAKKFNLTVQTTDWLSREEGAKYFKDSTQLMNQVFSDSVLKDKRNTEAVEVAPNNLIAARVVDYKAEAPKTFDDVKEGIEAVLKLEASMKLAEEKGQSILTKLEAGEEDETLDWIPEVTVDRKNAQGLTEPVMNQVFKINASELPAYTGFSDGNRAYVLVKVSKVINAIAEDETLKEKAQFEYEAALAQAYVNAYGDSLKAKADIEISKKILEPGPQQP
ncbi:MAG: SurA N-terminal domain-containing protein [Methylophilaceae bacterium]